jgi:hypothetical protein
MVDGCGLRSDARWACERGQGIGEREPPGSSICQVPDLLRARVRQETMNVVFAAALFAGAAAIAVWVAVRFPRLAPRSLTARVLVTLGVAQLLAFVPIEPGSYLTLYGSVFGLALPILTLAWLGAFWLLQALRDAIPS